MATPNRMLSSRAERVLAAMAGTVLLLTIVAIVANFVLHATLPRGDFDGGALAFVAVFPLPGLAIFLLLTIALITVSGIVRARAQQPPRRR